MFKANENVYSFITCTLWLIFARLSAKTCSAFTSFEIATDGAVTCLPMVSVANTLPSSPEKECCACLLYTSIDFLHALRSFFLLRRIGIVRNCLIIDLRNTEMCPSRHFQRQPMADRKSTRLNSSHSAKSRMPSSA